MFAFPFCFSLFPLTFCLFFPPSSEWDLCKQLRSLCPLTLLPVIYYYLLGYFWLLLIRQLVPNLQPAFQCCQSNLSFCPWDQNYTSCWGSSAVLLLPLPKAFTWIEYIHVCVYGAGKYVWEQLRPSKDCITRRWTCSIWHLPLAEALLSLGRPVVLWQCSLCFTVGLLSLPAWKIYAAQRGRRVAVKNDINSGTKPDGKSR